jgi:hypothetical protein
MIEILLLESLVRYFHGLTAVAPLLRSQAFRQLEVLVTPSTHESGGLVRIPGQPIGRYAVVRQLAVGLKKGLESTRAMAQKLSTQLHNFGCEIDPAEFKRVLAVTKQELFPELTEERLVCTDDENGIYCDAVCSRVGVELPRPFIRFQLLNNHK